MLTETQLNSFKDNYGFQPDLFTSAKTGENVEDLFRALGIDLLEQN